MTPRSHLDPGYIAAVTRLFKRVEKLLEDVEPRLLPLHVTIAGGAAALFHASMRPSRDIDASFSLRVHLPADLEETYTDRDGQPRSVYLDANYNDTLGPMHADALAAAVPVELTGIDALKLDVRVLAPIDLAISKLGRFSEHDRADIEAMARAGLLKLTVFERRAAAALKYYVGHPAAPRANLRDALAIIRAATPKAANRGTAKRASAAAHAKKPPRK